MKKAILSVCICIFIFSHISYSQRIPGSQIINLKAKETITPVELNYGEAFQYTAGNNSVLRLELISTSANILYTNRDKIPSGESGNDRGNMWRARLMYEFSCEVMVNGQSMTMRRYVGSQETFYEPYVVNGVRIWFDAVLDIFEQDGGFLNTARSSNGKPNKKARFLLQDMESRICPGEIHPWFIDGEDLDDNYIYKDNFIDVGRSFNGDTYFLGAYLGGESHGALDVNMAMNSLMYAPFALDTQEGIRAAGTKTWPDGSVWGINTGHVIEKYVPDNVPVLGGEVYGKGARRGCWWHPHAHFAFEITERGVKHQVDTWIIFWQLFEDNKLRDGVLRAMMEPLSHSSTGKSIKFKGKCLSGNDDACHSLKYYWAFGDGGSGIGKNVEHIYSEAGVYPVTLTISNGKERATFTQHITIEGTGLPHPLLILEAENEPFFRKRPQDAMDVYGWPVKYIPNTLEFLSRPSRPVPNSRQILVKNAGGGQLSGLEFGIDYRAGMDWVNISSTGEGNDQQVEIEVDGGGLPPGKYLAYIAVHSKGALNSPQRFRVVMNIPEIPTSAIGLIVDDKDPGFYCTPWFWVGHRFHGWGWPELKNAEGYNNFYLMNGQRDRKGEYARFTPDLEKGKYNIWLYENTPFASGPPANNEPARFMVRVVHAEGEDTLWMEPEPTKGFFPRPYMAQNEWRWLEPQPSRRIGTFQFEEGMDGYVEIWAEGSSGQVIVDGVRFLKAEY